MTSRLGTGKAVTFHYSVTYIVLIVLQKEPSFAPFVNKIDSSPASTGYTVTERRKTKRWKGLSLCLMTSGIVDQMRYKPVGFSKLVLGSQSFRNLFDVHFHRMSELLFILVIVLSASSALLIIWGGGG